MIRSESPVYVPAKHEGRYDDLIFTPLDLPPVPEVDIDQFIEWMKSDPLKTGTMPKERFERITGKRYPWLMRVVSSDLESLHAAFPEVLQYARTYPFKTIKALVFLAQDGHEEVFPHADSDGLVGMRFYLANKNVDGLHFFKGKQPYDYFNGYKSDESGKPTPVGFENYFRMDEPIYARFPDTSRAFMLNSARAIHAVDENTCQLGDRIAVLVQGELDHDRLNALIGASLCRYQEYAIWY